MRVAEVVRKSVFEMVANGVIASPLVPRPLRWRLLSAIGLDVSRCALESRIYVGGRDITIGPRAFLNVGVHLDNAAPISIGADCQIGPQVMLCTGTHAIGERRRRAGDARPASIIVEDGAWLGARVTVLPGVTVGAGCVIAAGAMVTADCAPDGVYAGVPARRVRDLSLPGS